MVIKPKSCKLAQLKSSYKYAFYIGLALYMALLLWNLDRVPVAWTDETQLLDPSSNYVYEGRFYTNLQPFPSSKKVYATSLPVLQWVHIVSLKCLGNSMYSVRFPMALAALLCALILFIYGRKMRYHGLLILCLPLLFLNDINVYEMIRSGRMEIFSALFFLLSFYWLSQSKHVLSTLALSFLILTHPAAWAAGLVLFVYNWCLCNKRYAKLHLPLLVILPTIGWFYMVDFNFYAIQEQILGQGNYHAPEVKEGNFISNLLWHRFWPFWKPQPYLILFHFAALGLAVYTLKNWRQWKNHALEMAFIFTEILMAFKLATHHRYNVLLVLMIVLILAKFAHKHLLPKRERTVKWVLLLMLPLILFPFTSRNLLGLAEREARDPKAILEWLQVHLPSTPNTLVTGSDILHYHAMQKPEVTFFEKIYPQDIPFDKYAQFYILTHEKPHPLAVEIKKYSVPLSPLGQWLNRSIKTKNYNGLTLYKLPNSTVIKEITAPYDITI